MNRTKRHILSLIVVIVLLAIPTLTVFAKELGMLTITGPGIKGELTLNDHEDMMNLERSGFFEQPLLTKQPDNLDLKAGYTLTAHLNLDGKLVPFAQMVYYATTEGKTSFIHYTGRLNGETLEAVDEWYVLSREEDTLLRSMMNANNITVQSALVAAAAPAEPAAPVAEPVTVPAVPPVSIQTPYILPALAALLLVLVGAGLILRRRAVRHSSV